MSVVAAEAHRRPSRRMWLAISGPALAYPLAGIDPLLLNLNLGAVGRGLDVASAQMGMLAGAATLVVAATVLAVGNVGDRFGLRRVLMVGLAGSIVVSSISAAAPTFGVLLALRVAQGFALAALLGVSMALVAASVPDRKRPLAIGGVMAIYTAMYGLAPVVGGWVVGEFGWRALFLVTVPVAIAALACTWAFAREPRHGVGATLDAWGVVLFGVVLMCLVSGLSSARSGFSRPGTWVPLVIAAGCLAVFVRRERRIDDPALDLGLFTHRAFTVAILATVATNVFAAGLGTLLGQLGTYVLGLTSSTIGLLYLPGTVIVATASVLAGRVVARRGTRPVLVAGLLTVTASGLVLAVTVSPVMGLAVLVAGIWLDNLGGFVSGTASADAILAEAPRGRTGSVAAVQPAAAMSGYALGPTVVMVLLQVFFRGKLVSDATAQGVDATAAQADLQAAAAAMASTPGGSTSQAVSFSGGLHLGADYTGAAEVVLAVLSALVLVVAVLGLVLLRKRSAAPPAAVADDISA